MAIQTSFGFGANSPIIRNDLSTGVVHVVVLKKKMTPSPSGLQRVAMHGCIPTVGPAGLMIEEAGRWDFFAALGSVAQDQFTLGRPARS